MYEISKMDEFQKTVNYSMTHNRCTKWFIIIDLEDFFIAICYMVSWLGQDSGRGLFLKAKEHSIEDTPKRIWNDKSDTRYLGIVSYLKITCPLDPAVISLTPSLTSLTSPLGLIHIPHARHSLHTNTNKTPPSLLINRFQISYIVAKH